MRENRAWLAALEGYYGPPLAHDERVALWCSSSASTTTTPTPIRPKTTLSPASAGVSPTPPTSWQRFAELVAVCDDAGLELAMTMNPGSTGDVDDPSEVDALDGEARGVPQHRRARPRGRLGRRAGRGRGRSARHTARPWRPRSRASAPTPSGSRVPSTTPREGPRPICAPSPTRCRPKSASCGPAPESCRRR